MPPKKQIITQPTHLSANAKVQALSKSNQGKALPTPNKVQQTVATAVQNRQVQNRVQVQQTVPPPIPLSQWTLEEVIDLLYNHPSGKEALKRLENGAITISHQKANGEFTKQIVDDLSKDEASQQLIDSPKKTGMDGFGEESIIYISAEMDSAHAAAMIVHESTHSEQKLPGGSVYEWTHDPSPNKKTRDEMELEMEVEAHINQFRFEVETNSLSQKGAQCLDDSDPKVVDPEKVKKLVEAIYLTTAPPTGSKQAAAKKESLSRRKTTLIKFKDASNVKHRYNFHSNIAPLVARFGP